MPSGKTHDKITYLTAFVWTGLVLWGWLLFFSRPSPDSLLCFIVFIVSYLFGSLFLSPDLDLEHSDPHNRWGQLGCGWRWIPYAYLIDHRSGWSHSPFRGCLLRLVALAVAGMLFIGGAVWGLWRLDFYGNTDFWTAWGDVLEGVRDTLREHPVYLLFALLGLYLSGLVHILSDVMVSRWKGMFRWGRRRKRRR
jgi:uncharacterized metal-binding protein